MLTREAIPAGSCCAKAVNIRSLWGEKPQEDAIAHTHPHAKPKGVRSSGQNLQPTLFVENVGIHKLFITHSQVDDAFCKYKIYVLQRSYAARQYPLNTLRSAPYGSVREVELLSRLSYDDGYVTHL